ncbi:angiopoietin-4-like [Anopheles bellator]|uniref:angiopoietin-4-like n=1 Tax=Anopheles bellator TaxID=139047 RepID=UPI00264922C7|nr:angiopoietin-4-like [Anopheles bellator]
MGSIPLCLVILIAILSLLLVAGQEANHVESSTNDQLKDIQKQLFHLDRAVRSLSSQMDDLRSKRDGVTTLPTSSCRATISNCGAASSDVSGVYLLQLCAEPPYQVFCNQTFENGGWLVVYSRSNGNETRFDRTWESYKHGFGHPEGEHFIGLQRLHALTSASWYEVAFVLMRQGEENVGLYDRFEIGSEWERFQIKRIGTAKGSMRLFHADQSYMFHTANRNNLHPEARETMVQEGCAFWFIDTPHSIDNAGFAQFCHNLKQLKIMIRKRAGTSAASEF